MTLPLLIDSTTCGSRSVCRTCRDLEGGRWMRAAWASLFTLPEGGVDFACPFGHKWGYVPAGALHDHPKPPAQIPDDYDPERDRYKGRCCS